MYQFKLKSLVFMFLLAATVALSGCGDDGAQGPAGPTGPAGPAGPTGADGQDVDPATVDNLQAQIDAIAGAGDIESCAICHKDVSAVKHQDIYDKYTDTSDLGLTIDSVASVANAADPATFDTTVTFSITKDGLPFVDADGLPALDQKRMYAVTYDSATGMYFNSQSFGSFTGTATAGTYTATASGVAYQTEASNAFVYAYIADGQLDIEPSAGHVTLYDNVASAALAFGTAQATDPAAYLSAANVSACEKCHGTPYRKHGYREAAVTGLPDFASCKTCHYDDRNGGHVDWQILVDNPLRYAEIHEGDAVTDAEKVKYAYTANIMNDVHMSHAMEFPYPQAMANCVTCHEGKLDTVLADANFTATTCKSCHPLDGDPNYPDPNRAPAIRPIWVEKNLETTHASGFDAVCNRCHNDDPDLKVARSFKQLHTGYDSEIYDATGTPYTDIFQASVDNASLDGTTLTIEFSAVKAVADNPIPLEDMTPHVVLGLYGYDTKNMIVSGHNRDIDSEPNLEFAVGSDTARMKTVSSATGAWVVTADLSYWADMITSGAVNFAEIAVLPSIKDAAGTTVAVNAPSRTFDLVTNAFDDTAAIITDVVDFANCNKCHDALMPPNHARYVGTVAGNMNVCRVCHTPEKGAGHLEMQSRSIDSYVHSIHSFQAFDIGNIDFTDPVEKTKYELHIEHRFPNFTIKNCEGCHYSDVYNVPDQSQSLPGLFSSSADVTTWDRKIRNVPAYVSGPASRACGACHRADLIKEDDAGSLASLNQHTKDNGYLIGVANDDEAKSVLASVIEKIMSFFY